MWHACGPYSVEKFLEGKGQKARELYNGLVALLRKCGPIEIAPAKTRIAFMVRVRFAGVSNLSDRGMTVGFALRRPLKNPRILKVVQFNPRWYGHYLRVKSVNELDEEVLSWLCEAYKVGNQES
jgi:hypothetical protein